MIDKWHLELFSYILERVSDPQRVVEIGVHKGETLRWMRDYTGAQAVGIDSYPDMSSAERTSFIKEHVSDLEIWESGLPDKIDVLHYDAVPRPNVFKATTDGLIYKIDKMGLVAIDNFDTKTPAGASFMTRVVADSQNFPFTLFCVATDYGHGRAYACPDPAYESYFNWVRLSKLPKYMDMGVVYFDSRFKRDNNYQENQRDKWP